MTIELILGRQEGLKVKHRNVWEKCKKKNLLKNYYAKICKIIMQEKLDSKISNCSNYDPKLFLGPKFNLKYMWKIFKNSQKRYKELLFGLAMYVADGPFTEFIENNRFCFVL